MNQFSILAKLALNISMTSEDTPAFVLQSSITDSNMADAKNLQGVRDASVTTSVLIQINSVILPRILIRF
jgi:hypothetical protein